MRLERRQELTPFQHPGINAGARDPQYTSQLGLVATHFGQGVDYSDLWVNGCHSARVWAAILRKSTTPY